MGSMGYHVRHVFVLVEKNSWRRRRRLGCHDGLVLSVFVDGSTSVLYVKPFNLSSRLAQGRTCVMIDLLGFTRKPTKRSHGCDFVPAREFAFFLMTLVQQVLNLKMLRHKRSLVSSHEFAASSHKTIARTTMKMKSSTAKCPKAYNLDYHNEAMLQILEIRERCVMDVIKVQPKIDESSLELRFFHHKVRASAAASVCLLLAFLFLSFSDSLICYRKRIVQ